MGEADRHARFRLQSGSRSALGVAFGVNGELTAAELADPLDVSLKLELNEWNGAVEPRVVLGELYPGGSAHAAEEPPYPDRRGVVAQARRRARGAARRLAASAHPGRRCTGPAPGGGSAGRLSGVAAVAALASSGDSVLALCADALRRRELVERAAAPARFGGGRVAIASGRLADDAARAAVAEVAEAGTGVALADWAALARMPVDGRRASSTWCSSTRRLSHTSSVSRPPLEPAGTDTNRFPPPRLGGSGDRAGAESPRRGMASAPCPGGAVSAALRPSPTGTLSRSRSKAPRQPSPLSGGRRPSPARARGARGGPLAAVRHRARPPRRILGDEGSRAMPAFVAYRDRHEEGRRFLSRRRQPS